jgi:hypothetical protein
LSTQDCAFQLGAAVPGPASKDRIPEKAQGYVPASVDLFVLDCERMGNLGHALVRRGSAIVFPFVFYVPIYCLLGT